MLQQADRQFYIDWLRAGAMFFLVFYHTGRLFDYEPWHIKSAELNFGIEVFNRILDVWQMPLFFLLAGAAVWFSISRRAARGFAGERVSRLLVPLTFGMLVIVPPQVYFERVFDGDFSGSFLAWYPHTFQGTYQMGSAAGNFSWHHLWFLAYLFVFSLLLLPLFHYLSGEKGRRLVSRVAAFLTRPGAIFLPAAPLIIYNVFLLPVFGAGNQNLISDWRNFLFYITVYFYGFLFTADSRIAQTARSYRYTALGAAAAILAAIYLLETGVFSLPEPWLLAFYALDCWCWLIAIMGIGMVLLNFSNRLLRYANDAVLPVYILHQTLIVTIGFYVINRALPLIAAYFIIAAATLAGSLAVYEAVRRSGVTRFLFGIKVRRRTG